MLPSEIAYGSIKFELRPRPNALEPNGQRIILPQGTRRVYVLAASVDDDQKVDFKIGSMSVNVNVQSWGGFIGQWDTRQWKSKEVPIPPRSTRNTTRYRRSITTAHKNENRKIWRSGWHRAGIH